jgi:hypothetical protein
MDFYQNLFSSGPLEGLVQLPFANFWNSYELYELVDYLYHHNETVHDELDNAEGTISTLEQYALILEEARNIADDNANDRSLSESIFPIAGRTLAQRILTHLKRNIGWNSGRDKLTVMFGSYEPLLAYFSLAGLLTGPNVRSGAFDRFPQPGAAFVFELISAIPEDGASQELDPDNLSIRFYYRANATDEAEFEEFSLFGTPEDSSIPYTAFRRSMEEIGVATDDWCGVCQATTSNWCPASGSDNNDEGEGGGSIFGSSSNMSPAVAGVIGAVIMLAITGFAAAALYALLGLRVRRVGKQERSGTLGGFKGAEKMPDDPDVAVNNQGSRHERTGSWELRGGGGPPSVSNVPSAFSKDDARSTTRDLEREGDDASVFGATVVKEHESV